MADGRYCNLQVEHARSAGKERGRMARRKPSKQATTKSEFQLRKDGIYWRNASGELEYVGPWLKILAVASTPDGSDWSKLLVFRDHLGKLREERVPDSWLHDGGHD